MQGFFSKKEGQLSSNYKLSCVSCGLYHHAESPKMKPTGKGQKKILNIGPAPTQTDDEKNKHWTGQSGRLLRRTLKEFDIDTERDCWNINAIQCHPAEV